MSAGNTEIFTGYRIDLENKEAIRLGSAPYAALLRGPEDYQETNAFLWWHVRNQGMQGSCRGHSLAANARLSYHLQAGEIDLDGDGVDNEVSEDDFSPDWCYYQAQIVDGIRGDSGATINGGIKVGMQIGILPERFMPYTVAYDPGRMTKDQLKIAADSKFGRYTEITSADMAFDWVGSGQGGIDWGTVWSLPFVKGCLVKGISRAARGGGHATAGIGLVRGETLIRWIPALQSEVRSDEWVMMFANSHSEQAQYRGFYFVTKEGLQSVLEHPYTTAIGWSDMNAPRKRRFDFRKKSVFG